MKILKDNHGFSLVEILAVMAILIILMGIGVGAYTRYRKKAIESDYELIQKNTLSAAENYFMDNINATSVDFDKLVEESYLEKVVDPAHKKETCTGNVIILEAINSDNPEAIQSSKYKVDLTCGKEKRCMVTNSKLGCDSEGGISTDGKTTYYMCGVKDNVTAPENKKSTIFKEGITLVARVKFNELKTESMDYFGNWQNGGGGLGLSANSHTFFFNEYIVNEIDAEHSQNIGYKTASSSVPAIRNRWYVVVGTYDNNNLELYINGEKKATYAVQGYISASPMEFIIGGNPQPVGDGWPMRLPSSISISNALIFNKAISQDIIEANYSNPDIAISYTADAIYSKAF